MRTLPSPLLVLAVALGGCAAATGGSDPVELDPSGRPTRPIAERALPDVTGAGTPHGAERQLSDDEPFHHPEPIYSVVMVEEGDVLNVRAGAGTEHEVVDALAPESSEITGTGREQTVDGQRWVEILRPTSPGTGWVNAYYVTEVVLPARFCTDTEVDDLLTELTLALREQNGERLFGVVSPVRGLSVRYLPHGETLHVTDDEARDLFEDRANRDWGMHPYTGERVRGSFADMVAPDLEALLTHPNMAPHCNTLAIGGAAYDATLPTGMGNFNFYALHFAGTETYGGLDWLTWVVGVDYSEGVPYVVSLHRFAR